MALACYNLWYLQSGSFGHLTSWSLVHIFVVTIVLILTVRGAADPSMSPEITRVLLCCTGSKLITMRVCTCLMTTIGTHSGAGKARWESMMQRVIAITGKLPRVKYNTLFWWYANGRPDEIPLLCSLAERQKGGMAILPSAMRAMRLIRV